MVMDNLPSLREPLPYQREHAADISFVSFQMPVPQHKCCIRPQKTELQRRKIELSHGPTVRIVFLVPSQHSVPPPRDSAAPGKRQLRRMPVAHEERIHIPAV